MSYIKASHLNEFTHKYNRLYVSSCVTKTSIDQVKKYIRKIRKKVKWARSSQNTEVTHLSYARSGWPDARAHGDEDPAPADWKR